MRLGKWLLLSSMVGIIVSLIPINCPKLYAGYSPDCTVIAVVDDVEVESGQTPIIWATVDCVKSCIENLPTYQVGENIFIECVGFGKPESDIDWPLEKGDRIEFVGMEVGGGYIVDIRPNYVRCINDRVPAWRKSIKPGDILLRRAKQGTILNCLLFMTHCGIYVGCDQVVEAFSPPGVSYHSITEWDFNNQTWVDLYGLKDRQDATRIKQRVVAFARQLADTPGTKFRFPIPWRGKHSSITELKWYCSELVWAAYYHSDVDLGTYRRVNTDPSYLKQIISPGLPLKWKFSGFGPYRRVTLCPPEPEYISPVSRISSLLNTNISTDDDIERKAYHHEELPCGCVLDGLIFLVYSPVEVDVTDPDGLTTNKARMDIPESLYLSLDTDQDMSDDVQIGIEKRKLGDYSIRLTPKPDAKPDDTFSLIAISGDSAIVLAEDTPVSQIPDKPYILKSISSGIEPGGGEEQIQPGDVGDIGEVDGGQVSTNWFSSNWPGLLVVLTMIGVLIYGIRSRKTSAVQKGEAIPKINAWLNQYKSQVVVGSIALLILLLLPLFPVTKNIETSETVLTEVTKHESRTVQTEEQIRIYSGWLRNNSGQIYKVNPSDEIKEITYSRVPNNLWDISTISMGGEERIFRDIADYDLAKTSSIMVPETTTTDVIITSTVPQQVTKSNAIKLNVNLIQFVFSVY